MIKLLLKKIVHCLLPAKVNIINLVLCPFSSLNNKWYKILFFFFRIIPKKYFSETLLICSMIISINWKRTEKKDFQYLEIEMFALVSVLNLATRVQLQQQQHRAKFNLNIHIMRILRVQQIWSFSSLPSAFESVMLIAPSSYPCQWVSDWYMDAIASPSFAILFDSQVITNRSR